MEPLLKPPKTIIVFLKTNHLTSTVKLSELFLTVGSGLPLTSPGSAHEVFSACPFVLSSALPSYYPIYVPATSFGKVILFHVWVICLTKLRYRKQSCFIAVFEGSLQLLNT